MYKEITLKTTKGEISLSADFPRRPYDEADKDGTGSRLHDW